MNNTRVSYLRYLLLDHSLLLSQSLSYPTHAASMLLFNVTTFNSRELPASNFSLQCLCRITPSGHENLGNDRPSKEALDC